MYITKYDQRSGTALTMDWSSYMHFIVIAVAICTAPVLGPIAYVISLCVDPEIQGAVFLASWAGLLMVLLLGYGVYGAVRQVRDTKSYYENLPR